MAKFCQDLNQARWLEELAIVKLREQFQVLLTSAVQFKTPSSEKK